MPIPPAQSSTSTNTTPQLDTHPTLHNQIAAAINDLRTHLTPISTDSIGLNAVWSSGTQRLWKSGSTVTLMFNVTRTSPTNYPAGQVFGTLPAAYRPTVNSLSGIAGFVVTSTSPDTDQVSSFVIALNGDMSMRQSWNNLATMRLCVSFTSSPL